VDLREVCFGRSPWGCRQLLGHIESLPPRESAFARSRLGEDVAQWTTGVELQAATVDLLHGVIRTLQQAHFEDPPRDKLPRVPRPALPGQHAPVTSRPTVSLTDFASMIRED
jgi:hypothetical protein